MKYSLPHRPNLLSPADLLSGTKLLLFRRAYSAGDPCHQTSLNSLTESSVPPQLASNEVKESASIQDVDGY